MKNISKQGFTKTISLVLVGLVLFFAIVFVLGIVKGDEGVLEENKIKISEPIRGKEDAVLVIYQYCDFSCPYCKETSNILKNILGEDKYSSKVKVIWRDLPLASIHPESKKAAMAARCAEQQGKFWEYHDLLFANQERFSRIFYGQVAQSIGIDMREFNFCLDTNETLGLVNASSGLRMAGSVRLPDELNSTPIIVIGESSYNYAPTIESLSRVLDGEIGG